MEKYYYLDSANNQCGPVEASQLGQCGVTSQTFVWREGMADWKRAGELPELSAYVGGSPATPGAQYAPGSAPMAVVNQPSSNLVWAILTTVLCCMPTGIYAIICAAKVDTLWYAGRYEEARRMSRKAGQWSVISAIVAIVVWILEVMWWSVLILPMMRNLQGVY